MARKQFPPPPDLALVRKRLPIGIQKEVVVECYKVLSGILLEILRKTTKIISGKCVTWQSFEPGTYRIQNRIISWANLNALFSYVIQRNDMYRFSVSDHCMGIIANFSMLKLLPLMASVYWMFCNTSEFKVQILICVPQELLLQPATDLFGLTRRHHEVRRASVCPHHSRMEKTVHKLRGRWDFEMCPTSMCLYWTTLSIVKHNFL